MPTTTTTTHSTTTTTPSTTITTATSSGTTTINVVVVFIVNTQSVNFNDPVVVTSIINDLEIQLTTLYKRRSIGFRRVRVFNISEGSLNVNYTVEFDNTTEAAAEATTATIDLRTGAETIEVLNATVSASELAVDGKTIPSSPTDQDVCDLFTSTIDGCPVNYECNIENTLPTCQRVQEPNTLPLIIGIGIGVPVCLLLLVLAATLIWYANKQSAQKKKLRRHEELTTTERSYEQPQFPLMAPYKAMNGWREKPGDIFVPFEYTATRASTDTPPDTSIIKDQCNTIVVYDNKGAEFDDFTNGSHDRNRPMHKERRRDRY